MLDYRAGYNPEFLLRRKHGLERVPRTPRGRRDLAQQISMKQAREVTKAVKVELAPRLKEVAVIRQQAQAEATSVVKRAKADAREILRIARQQAAEINRQGREKAKGIVGQAKLITTTAAERGSSGRAIIADVAREHSVTRGDITGVNRSAVMVAIRHKAICRVYLARPDMSLPQIGRIFGDRDHTTILHALKKMGVYKPCRSNLSVVVA